MRSILHRLSTPYYQHIHQEFANYQLQLGYSPGQRINVNCCLREFLYFSEQQALLLEQVQPAHTYAYYHYLEQRPNYRREEGGLSGTSFLRQVYALRLFFSYLQETGQLQQNPISGCIFPKVQSNQREILSQPEIHELYKATRTLRDKAILGLFYGCGLRRREAENLNVADIHFKEQLLYVREGKGKKRRVIPLTGRVSEDFKNYYLYERSSYIIQPKGESEQSFMLNNKGRPMRGCTYLCYLNHLLRRSTIEKSICLHSLRHSIATHLLENGLALDDVRQFLGHKYLETTQHYTRISQQQLLAVTLSEKETNNKTANNPKLIAKSQ